MEQITIRCKDRKRVEYTVDVDVIERGKYLFVHSTHGESTAEYTVTHIASGMSVVLVDNLNKATKIMRDLDTFEDVFSKTTKEDTLEVAQNDKKLLKKLAKYRNEKG